MTLMNVYIPGGLISQLNDEMNRMFAMSAGHDDVSAKSGDWVPAVDIAEDETSYRIHADVPGVKPEDVEVELENGVLTLKGKRDETKTEEAEGFRRVERVSGQFYRRFTMPDTVNADAISAKTEHGVLEIVIPKQPKPEPKRIKVNG